MRVELAPGFLLNLRGVGQKRGRLERLRGGVGGRQLLLLGAEIIPGLRERTGTRVHLTGETSISHVSSHIDTELRH